MSTELPAQAKVLSISCVTYSSDFKILRATIESLATACQLASKAGLISTTNLYLIDNGPDDNNLSLITSLQAEFFEAFTTITLKTGHGNVGYGKGHNLSIIDVNSDYHLVLNPDVIVAPDNILEAINYSNQHPEVGLLAPDAMDLDGNRQYIAKRQPEILVLLARALGVKLLNKYLVKQMASYEYRDLIPAEEPIDIDYASGCYMFFRTNILKKAGGFNPDFFMYFEDFELTGRIKKLALVKHHPQLKIIHHGGGVSRKGLKHIGYFFSSFVRFKLS